MDIVETGWVHQMRVNVDKTNDFSKSTGRLWSNTRKNHCMCLGHGLYIKLDKTKGHTKNNNNYNATLWMTLRK